MKNSICISKRNSKVKAKIFNLPRYKTCPGRTEICEIICYAQVAEYMYEDTKEARARNLRASKEAGFVDAMVDIINRLRDKNFRIHESGDFYNQAYLDKWTEIISRCPDKNFFAYTRSHMLDFSRMLDLPNINLRYSVDRSTEVIMQGVPLALADSKPKKGFFTCPGSAKAGAKKCMVDCSECVTSKKDIYFHLHGPRAVMFKPFENRALV